MGRTLSFVVARHGQLLRDHVVGDRGVRHGAAERAHGPAHGAVDDGAAVPGARRPGDAGAAHAAAPGRAAGCWRVLHSRLAQGAVVPAADVPAVRGQPVGALLHRLVRRLAAVGLRARDDARPPGAGRVAVLLAAGRRRPGPGPGGLPVPAAADLPHAAVPRLPGRDDHGPGGADRGGLVPALRRWPGCPTPRPTSTSPAGSCGAPATWSG